ncbi:MAG: xanthine dehydrogenase family protein molybdopterin-binding subunit [Nitrospiraceae bacterium]|nr:xanthine dehydrogenase family protein molybdopterin-binding subunit [Nitrospiraceae bacterium]
MSGIFNVSRREFLKTGALVGGGLILGAHIDWAGAAEEGAKKKSYAIEPNAFVHIAPDNTVTITVNHSEMGQGVYTSLPMLVNEELGADWKNIRFESAPVAAVYNHTAFGMQMTGGSTSVWSEYDRLREVGAAARQMLVAAAAAEWKVDRKTCRAQKGKVVHTSGKSFTYGQLAEKAAGLPVPKEIKLKKASLFKVIGKPTRRLDSQVKVSGAAQFGLDADLPGMLIAVVARPPVFGGKVKSLDAEKAKAVPGVKDVLQVPSGVAVLATDFWQAKTGRDALKIEWEEGPNAGISTPAMKDQYAKLSKTPGKVAKKTGDVEAGFASAAKTISAEYGVPYLAHATMEPMNCAVDLRPGSCEIWVGTQFQTVDRGAAAQIAGLKPEQVKIHTMFLGGGFGRRANPASDFVSEAVHVAKAAKAPVKVIWTREDDTRGGYYRPMWSDSISAGLDKSGKAVAWKHTIVGQSIVAGTPFEKVLVKDGIDNTSVEGAADIPYAIPNLLVDLHTTPIGVPVLWWRSVGHSHTAFVVESFLDELAHAAKKDPFEFRKGLLAKHPRHLGVLTLAAEKAGWGRPLPKGRGRGIAVHESFGTCVAEVADVSVNKDGELRVHRVVCAVDCGQTVNPETIRAQMESAIVFGLSAALHGAITLKEGKVEQGNFDDYPILRLYEMPKVEVHIVKNREKPGGIGEPAVPPLAPAVANALFSLAGVRLRELPMKPDAVREAMKKRG